MRSEVHEHRASIPAVVYVTSPQAKLAGDLDKLWQANRVFFPEGAHFEYYNDTRMARSAQEISDLLEAAGVVKGAYRAYSDLRPGAFRADLWRYMKLWASGGVYIDAKIRLTAPLADWVNFEQGTLHLVKDWTVGSLYNAMVASGPRDPLMARVIQLVVGQIQSRAYCDQPAKLNCSDFGYDCGVRSPGYLAITGPLALSKAVGLEGVHGVRGQWSHSGFHTGLPDGFTPVIAADLLVTDLWTAHHETNILKVAKASDPSHIVAVADQAVHKAQAGGQYFTLWQEHKVYCDEPGPACML